MSLFTAQAIPGGKVVIDVSFFGVHVHQETHDLCDELSCPVAEGDFVLSHTQTLPGFTPPVSFISMTYNIVIYETIVGTSKLLGHVKVSTSIMMH